MPDPQKSEIITPPPNEQQPDREAQLDSDLSKLFDSPESKPKAEIKPIEAKKSPEKPEAPKEEGKEVAKEEAKVENKDKVPEPEKTESDDSKPKTKEGWKVLRDSHAQAKKTIAQKDDEIVKLKAALAEKGQTTSKELEDLKKEAEELKSYRAMVDIQADPEFTQKFDEPIAKRTDQIAAMLTSWGVAKEIIEKIDYTDPALLVRIEDTIAENKDKISAKKFLRLAEEVNELYDKRTEHLEEYKKNYKDLLEKKKKEGSTKQAENEGRMHKHIQTIAEMKNDKGETQFPFLTEMAAKDPTNPAEVEQVDRHNKAVGFMKEKLNEALKAETPEERAEVAVAAVSAHWTTAQLKAAMRKIESLQAELSKISKVSSETPKSQRTRAPSASSVENNGHNDLDLDAALNDARMSGRL